MGNFEVNILCGPWENVLGNFEVEVEILCGPWEHVLGNFEVEILCGPWKEDYRRCIELLVITPWSLSNKF